MVRDCFSVVCVMEKKSDSENNRKGSHEEKEEKKCLTTAFAYLLNELTQTTRFMRIKATERQV